MPKFQSVAPKKVYAELSIMSSKNTGKPYVSSVWPCGPSLCFISLFMPAFANAGTLVGGSQTLVPGDNVEAWTISQRSTLNVNGAETLGVIVLDSALNANGAITRQISASQGSAVSLSNSIVNGGNARAAVELINSSATINGTSINSNRLGLQVGREVTTSSGSSVTISDKSNIVGVTGGARATAFSNLALNDSRIESTGAGSTGMILLSATAAVTNQARITGASTGVTLGLESSGLPASSLRLDASTVEGKSGSAIVLDNGGSPAPATQIDVLNGSRLIGGNGTIVEVKGASEAALNVERTDLKGNVQVSDASKTALTFTQASLAGDVMVGAGSAVTVALREGSEVNGAMINVAHVGIDGASRWNLTGNSQVDELALNGGTVKLGNGATFYQLDVRNLSGSGLFEINTNFATNQSDVLNVTGTATGSHKLLVASSGNEPASGQPIQVVQVAAGDATFALANLNGEVDLGAFSYGLKQGETGNDWFLDPQSRSISPSTRAVSALFNTAPTVWYGEMTSLRSRMGEVRFNQEKSGAWLRAYGNKYNVTDAFGDGYRQTQQGFTLGADAPLPLDGGQWLLGVMAGQSDTDLNLHYGTSGSIKSYYIGSYLTWIDDVSGYYADGVIKLNRFRNDAKVGMSDGSRSKGDYDNNGIGASVEFGRHIKLDDGYFIEPFTQWSAVVVQSKDYQLNNGLQAEGDRTRSLLGKAGATVGREMHFSGGAKVQPYIRAAFTHEFSKSNEVKVNNNVFNNDLSGSRAEVGTGIALSLSDRWQVHAELEYMSGENIEMPLGGTLGIQLKW